MLFCAADAQIVLSSIHSTRSAKQGGGYWLSHAVALNLKGIAQSNCDLQLSKIPIPAKIPGPCPAIQLCMKAAHLVGGVDLVFALTLHLHLSACQLKVVHQGQQLSNHIALYIASNCFLLTGLRHACANACTCTCVHVCVRVRMCVCECLGEGVCTLQHVHESVHECVCLRVRF